MTSVKIKPGYRTLFNPNFKFISNYLIFLQDILLNPIYVDFFFKCPIIYSVEQVSLYLMRLLSTRIQGETRIKEKMKEISTVECSWVIVFCTVVFTNVKVSRLFPNCKQWDTKMCILKANYKYDYQSVSRCKFVNCW